MKLTTILTIGSILLFATACGPSYDDYYYGEEEYYYGDEDIFEGLSEEEIAMIKQEMGEDFGQDVSRFDQQEANQPHRQVVNRYAQQENDRPQSSNFSSGGKVEMRPIVDAQTGKTNAYAPLPSNWKIGAIWEGPGGTKVELRNGGFATYQQRPLNSVDQVIQQTIVPNLKKMGVKIDNIIDLPGIARNNQKSYALYWKPVPSQENHQVKGIEVSDPQKGIKGLFVVNFISSNSQYSRSNIYYTNVLTASNSRYEQDKKTLIYALENMQPDRQAVAAHNQREQQKSNASWAAHNNRMRQNRSNFDAFQKTQQTYSEISDIQHEGWKRRNAIQDAGHSNSINSGIWEREARINPNSGQQMNVQSGYKYYYMNEFGQYFGTNDEFYNPERDPNVNHLNWKKVQRPSTY
jgi:hypothetical protein